MLLPYSVSTHLDHAAKQEQVENENTEIGQFTALHKKNRMWDLAGERTIVGHGITIGDKVEINDLNESIGEDFR